jgi:hypothetical protein
MPTPSSIVGRTAARVDRTGSRIHPIDIALIRADSRDNCRETVLRCATPLPTARCISGCAARNASVAASLFPPTIANSTFLMKVRMRDLRAWLRSVRRSDCRLRLRAEAVLAMKPVAW